MNQCLIAQLKGKFSMTISRTTARIAGAASIASVLAFEWFQAASCFGGGPALAIFGMLPAAVALLPAFIWLLSKNPLNALGSVVFIMPLLWLVYDAECVHPPAGSSASMVLVALVIYGFNLGIAGAVGAAARAGRAQPGGDAVVAHER